MIFVIFPSPDNSLFKWIFLTYLNISANNNGGGDSPVGVSPPGGGGGGGGPFSGGGGGGRFPLCTVSVGSASEISSRDRFLRGVSPWSCDILFFCAAEIKIFRGLLFSVLGVSMKKYIYVTLRFRYDSMDEKVKLQHLSR
jgi:hypothetical protein